LWIVAINQTVVVIVDFVTAKASFGLQVFKAATQVRPIGSWAANSQRKGHGKGNEQHKLGLGKPQQSIQGAYQLPVVSPTLTQPLLRLHLGFFVVCWSSRKRNSLWPAATTTTTTDGADRNTAQRTSSSFIFDSLD